MIVTSRLKPDDISGWLMRYNLHSMVESSVVSARDVEKVPMMHTMLDDSPSKLATLASHFIYKPYLLYTDYNGFTLDVRHRFNYVSGWPEFVVEMEKLASLDWSYGNSKEVYHI